jgi:hypothetical protein
MSVINHSYIKKLVDKYNIFILLNYVKTRTNRMAMERIFAVLCFYDNSISKENASIYGNYLQTRNECGNEGKYVYDTYIKALQNIIVDTTPSKIYNGR